MITVTTLVTAPLQQAWDCYTQPEHIVHWNFASDDWQCPSATNDLRVGGTYSARMEAKDGSFGFDFEVMYTEILPLQKISYTMGTERSATVLFESEEGATRVTISFVPENQNSLELQQQGWQAILDNYKKHTETCNA